MTLAFRVSHLADRQIYPESMDQDEIKDTRALHWFAREWRSKRRLTQQKVADMVGTSKDQISRYERLEREPDMATINDIASALGVEVWQ